MKSYRAQRVRELKEGIEERHEKAGRVAQALIKQRTPVGTPSSTAKINYPVTTHLLSSIQYKVQGHEFVAIGTNVPYAKFVHNGTYKNLRAKDQGEWSETEARAWDAIRLWEYGNPPGKDWPQERDGNDGIEPRAFLVNGLLNGKSAYMGIYGKQIIGGPPHG